MTETLFDLEHMTLAELERWAIEGSMRRNKGDVAAVTKELDFGRSTFYRKLKQYEKQGRGIR